MSQWNDADHDFLDDLIRRLENAWRTAGAADLAQLVPAADHPMHDQALVVLVQADQELRWQHGQRKTVEQYLAEWPELQDKPACIRKLQEAQRLLEADKRTAPPDALAETHDFTPPNQARAIRIRCPHCHHPVEILDRQQVDEVTCPSCGIAFNVAIEGAVDFQSASKTVAPGVPRRIAHFELLKLLGEGALGLVWKAWDTKLNRTVAIKIPRPGRFMPDDVERFRREARAPADLHHPNIVEVFDVGQEGDLVYIVSEFIEGQSLDNWAEN